MIESCAKFLFHVSMPLQENAVQRASRNTITEPCSSSTHEPEHGGLDRQRCPEDFLKRDEKVPEKLGGGTVLSLWKPSIAVQTLLGTNRQVLTVFVLFPMNSVNVPTALTLMSICLQHRLTGS